MLGRKYRTYIHVHGFIRIVQILEIMKTVSEKTFTKMWNKLCYNFYSETIRQYCMLNSDRKYLHKLSLMIHY